MKSENIEVYLEKSKLTMRGKVYNPDAKVTALSWHGWLDNCLSFEDLAAELPELRIIALDIPGHGLSDHIPEGMAYFYHLFMVWASEWVMMQESDKIVLLGHSLGGTVFSMIAPMFPERIKALISIDAIGPITSTNEQLVTKMRASFDSYYNMDGNLNAIKHDFKDVVRIRAKVEGVSLEVSKRFCERDILETDGNIYWRTDKRLKLKSPHYFFESQIKEFFSRNKSKNLIIMGSEGLIGKLNKEHRVNYLEHCDLVKIEGGHHLHIDKAEKVAAVIKNWLEL